MHFPYANFHIVVEVVQSSRIYFWRLMFSIYNFVFYKHFHSFHFQCISWMVLLRTPTSSFVSREVFILTVGDFPSCLNECYLHFIFMSLLRTANIARFFSLKSQQKTGKRKKENNETFFVI